MKDKIIHKVFDSKDHDYKKWSKTKERLSWLKEYPRTSCWINIKDHNLKTSKNIKEITCKRCLKTII